MLAVLAEHRGFVIRKMPLRYGTRELNSMTEGIMMELDEAISHALEVTRQNEDSAILYKNCKEIKRNTYEVLTAEAAEQKCLSCAAEHRQLAEWLTELKELRDSVGAVKLSDMKEALELIRKYKAENIAQKKLIAEYKRLLKLAVPIINNSFPEVGSCWGCANHDEVNDECKGGAFAECAEVCKWKYADEALKLIGEDEDENNGKH
jgi:hypothetical protein